MKRLSNIYAGQSVWIIGKGSSLQYLTKEHIGSGPIITINQSIIKVQEIDLSNPIFSMQKDGGNRRRYPHKLIPDCDYTPNCGDRCGEIVRPKPGATLLVHKHESLYCFPDYSPRYVFDWKDFGLPGNVFSLIMAVKIGVLMGCMKFYFISCDAHVKGYLETYVPGIGVHKKKGSFTYNEQVDKLKEHLVGLNCEWIIPVKKNV